MRKGLLIAASAYLIFLLCTPAFAVTTTNLNSLTAQQLVQALIGSGVTFSNVTFTGSPLAGGTFSGGIADGIGIANGVILSSGDIANAAGPNNSDSTSTDFGLPGDAALDAILGGATTHDAAVLEFDFIPTQSSISFQYVFASEEYNEFVGTEFNDIFAFLLDGQNIALIPGTSTAVAINTVNLGLNSAYYKNNDPSLNPVPFGTQFDGFTTVLTAQANVTPNVSHHIKLVIADTSDGIYDSAVYLAGGTFVSGTTVSVAATDANAAEQGSDPGTFTITRSGDTSSALTVNYTMGGTATNGTDYSTLSGTVVIPAGASSVTVTVTPVDDTLVEGTETATMTLTAGTGYAIGNSSAAVTIADNDAVAGVVSVPTMTEWGMLIFTILAGFGSIYYLRRRKSV